MCDAFAHLKQHCQQGVLSTLWQSRKPPFEYDVVSLKFKNILPFMARYLQLWAGLGQKVNCVYKKRKTIGTVRDDQLAQTYCGSMETTNKSSQDSDYNSACQWCAGWKEENWWVGCAYLICNAFVHKRFGNGGKSASPHSKLKWDRPISAQQTDWNQDSDQLRQKVYN